MQHHHPRCVAVFNIKQKWLSTLPYFLRSAVKIENRMVDSNSNTLRDVMKADITLGNSGAFYCWPRQVKDAFDDLQNDTVYRSDLLHCRRLHIDLTQVLEIQASGSLERGTWSRSLLLFKKVCVLPSPLCLPTLSGPSLRVCTFNGLATRGAQPRP